MANREACELYIEQEIQDALKEGKKPYTIGKELAKWVEKLFETKIPANTIKNRAARLAAKSQPRKVDGRFDSNESKIKRVTDGKKKQAQIYRDLVSKEIADRLTKPVDTNMELEAALKIFGIPGCIGVTEESFKILYKGLSAKRHPDHAGGNADRMAELNIAKAVIQQLF